MVQGQKHRHVIGFFLFCFFLKKADLIKLVKKMLTGKCIVFAGMLKCVLGLPYVFVSIAEVPIFLCLLFNLRENNWSETTTILLHHTTVLESVFQQYRLLILSGHCWHLKAQNTLFLSSFWHPLHLSAWLTAVGCFIFATAVLIYLSLCDISACQRTD